MRTVVAGFVATVALLAMLAPSAAAPPEDVAAYCRATYPQVQFQVRCINVENAAAERVSRAGAVADREAFQRCLGSSPSWAAMESCLTQSARGGPAGGAPGVTAGVPRAGVDPRAPTPDQGGALPAPPSAVTSAPPSPAPTPPEAGPPSSTIVLGPQPQPPSLSAAEINRTPRPISEADAERHLRGVLERAGTPAARCAKKQYGPGWVIICD